ncbi:MAG TPA: rhomboid family intramembrane serine protease, partial [Actinomycetota bacterium]
FPWITLIIIALNVLAFLLWEPTFARGTEEQKQTKQIVFFYCHAEVPYEVTHQANIAEGGQSAREAVDEQDPLGPSVSGRALQRFLADRCPNKSWWQSVFVAMFLHGGWLHIGGNMLFLWIFGNNVEDKLSPILYFLFYMAAGIAASIGQLLVDTNSVVPNLGASGAIAGVLGAYIVMFPRRRILTLVFFFFITAIWLPAWVVLGAWFVLQLFSGVGSVTAHPTSGVAFFAHIGGFVFGAALALLFFPKEGLGTRPPPPRPDFQARRWGRGWGRRQPPAPEEGWRPH